MGILVAVVFTFFLILEYAYNYYCLEYFFYCIFKRYIKGKYALQLNQVAVLCVIFFIVIYLALINL